MHINDFDYDLPDELIAQTPLTERDHSRLMVLNRDKHTIKNHIFYEILDMVNPGDTLVFNNSRVIPARLIGHRPTGGRVEVFLLKQIDETHWEALVKPGRKARVGSEIIFSDKLQCKIVDNTDFGGRVVDFQFEGIFNEILDELGETPLPPYIHEKLADKERYQTVYSKVRGSAAAPTAGLHFTQELLGKLRDKGVNLAFVTLHVGLGTFRPVSTDNIEEHHMHTEYYQIDQETCDLINSTKKAGKRVIAVGTTAIRTLESAASIDGTIAPSAGDTNIFIYPGYKFKIVDAMITNFHLPKSTLVMLIAAFAGREFVLEAYRKAVEDQYRFFSFGDAMFIE